MKSANHRILAAIVGVALSVTSLTAQAQRPAPPSSSSSTLDRTKTPPPAKTPALRVPAWTKSTLSNGADFIVSEKHDLPLVSFTITFMGGADQFEPPARRGLAAITASMLSEGTRTRNGEALSNALQLLGTT